MPERLQLSRRLGTRLPAGTVNVARPTKWGNPFKVSLDTTAADAVLLYREAMIARLDAHPEATIAALEELRGRNLACWCRLDRPCHADVLLEMANRPLSCEVVK